MERTFRTEAGNEVTLRTETSDDYYFGLYLTSPQLNMKDVWIPPYQIIESSTLRFSYDLKSRDVVLPEDIAEEIRAEYNEAISNTGKIIVATIKNEEGKVCKTLYGEAKAAVAFTDYVRYEIPTKMEKSILIYTGDKKIYQYGGIEDEPVEAKNLTVIHSSRFLLRHFREDIPDIASLLNPTGKGEWVNYELELEVVDLIK